MLPQKQTEIAEKRRFLKQLLLGAGAAYLFAPLYAVWRYLLSPSEKRVPIVPHTLKSDDVENKRLTFLRFGNKNVLLRRDAETIRAFNLRCTHAGCTVEWQDTAQKFVCHCHGAEFHADGSVAKLPATEPLEELTIRREQGKMMLFDEVKQR
jgi:Rieske Fe-S protein